MTYDIEAMLCRDNLPADTSKMTFSSRHNLLSVSLCSNIPGHEEPEVVFVVNTTARECMSRFVARANALATVAETMMLKRYSGVVQKLKAVVNRIEKKEEKYAEAGFSNEYVYKRRARLRGLKNELLMWLARVPIVGFNSQKYDLAVIKAPLMKCIAKGVDFVVKKDGAMTLRSNGQAEIPRGRELHIARLQLRQLIWRRTACERRKAFSLTSG